MKKEFPHKICKIEGKLHEKFIQEVLGQPFGAVQVGSKKWVLPSKYAEFADQVYNFEARPDDVFVITYPRSGTTWTQEMIWLICNELDYETSLKIPQITRFPFFE